MEVAYKKSHVRIAYFLCASWIIATLFAFWWFQFKNLHEFNSLSISTRADFLPKSLRTELEDKVKSEFPYLFKTKKPVVIHLQATGCGCNRFNNPHLSDVVSTYRRKGVVFASLVLTRTPQAIIEKFKENTGIESILQNQSLQFALENVSSPAALVFDGNGELSYFGPYSSGAMCSTQSGQYVETSLDSLLSEKKTDLAPDKAFGCFCAWKKT